MRGNVAFRPAGLSPNSSNNSTPSPNFKKKNTKGLPLHDRAHVQHVRRASFFRNDVGKNLRFCDSQRKGTRAKTGGPVLADPLLISHDCLQPVGLGGHQVDVETHIEYRISCSIS